MPTCAWIDRRGARSFGALALAAALLLVLAACGDDDGAAAPTTIAPPPTVDVPTTADRSTTSEPASTTTLPSEPELGDVAVTLTEVSGGLESPIGFAVRAGDDALYVIEQVGRVRAVRDGELDPTPVIDLSNDIESGGNEQGLLGIAFSPDGKRLYLDFTDTNGDTRVVELAVTDRGVDPASRRDVLFVDQPYANHNGGHLAFGTDGMLYISLGDGGSGGDPHGNGQRLDTLLGKILRIDPRQQEGGGAYGIPRDNPFVGVEGARGEIWQYGLRNPWRFSFDRDAGDLWIGDVGQNTYEEIDFAPAGDAGVNWGWNLREGLHEFTGPRPEGARDPIHEYDHSQGFSVTGGYVYRGSAIPALRGAYVYADYAAGDLIAVDEDDGAAAAVQSIDANGGQVTSFGEDANGEIYVLDRSGSLLRLDPA
jgi:glucose/arabinose dehydrogenase